MTVAHRIVGAHNGNISVESKWGKGTTITISIPKGEKEFNTGIEEELA